MSKSSEPQLSSNRGGGCLEAYEVHSAAAGDHRLLLRGPQGVVDQLLIVASTYREEQEPPKAWTHCLVGPGPEPPESAQSLINVLGRVLTLPSPEHVDFAIALDWYKVAPDDDASSEWVNTRLGELVHRGKYWYSKEPWHAAIQGDHSLDLGERLAGVVDDHPVLRSVETIVAVPGHDPKRVSFGSLISAIVARRCGVRLVECRGVSGFRPPAKSLDLADRQRLITNQFTCPEDLTGEAVLIVDDIYSSSASVNETARAARAAGARRVAVLCVVRTMRS